MQSFRTAHATAICARLVCVSGKSCNAASWKVKRRSNTRRRTAFTLRVFASSVADSISAAAACCLDTPDIAAHGRESCPKVQQRAPGQTAGMPVQRRARTFTVCRSVPSVQPESVPRAAKRSRYVAARAGDIRVGSEGAFSHAAFPGRKQNVRILQEQGGWSLPPPRTLR